MVALMVTTLAACSKSDAQKSYDSAVEQYQKRGKALDNQVSELNKIIDKGGEPLYQEDLDNALTAVKEVEKERYKIPEMAKEDAEIEKQAKEIKALFAFAKVNKQNWFNTALYPGVLTEKVGV